MPKAIDNDVRILVDFVTFTALKGEVPIPVRQAAERIAELYMQCTTDEQLADDWIGDFMPSDEHTLENIENLTELLHAVRRDERRRCSETATPTHPTVDGKPHSDWCAIYGQCNCGAVLTGGTDHG